MKISNRNIFFVFGGIFIFPVLLFCSPKKIPVHSFSRNAVYFSDYYHRFYDEDNSLPGGWVCTPSVIFSYVNYLPQPGRLAVSFPYKLTDNANVITTQQFSAANDNLIGTGKWVYPSVGLEVGKENFTIEAQMGWYINYWSDNLYGGINYRFILKKAHRSPDQFYLGSTALPGKKFMSGAAEFPIKITAGIFYWQPIWNLGTIDIGDKQFDALGYSMNRFDSLAHGSNGVVTVYFHQNVVAFKPAFSIGYKPNFRVEFQFAVSPLIMISEVGGLRFYMNANGNVDWVPRDGISLNSVIPLDAFGLASTFNGETISSSPFHLKGIMYTFKVGVRIGN